MTSRQRLQLALNHQSPERVPVDFGSTSVTGFHVSALTRLRRAILGDNSFRVKVIEPGQMLGEVDEQLRVALGIDTVAIRPLKASFGFELGGWKERRLFDGTEVLVPGGFNITIDSNGDWLMHPQGDTSAPPCARMPKGGHFFDAIIRQQPIEEDKLNPADNLEEFGPLSNADVAHYAQRYRWLSEQSDAAIVAHVPGTSFGDIARVPGPSLRHPRGIRDVEEWYISIVSRPAYIRRVFDRQCEIALANLACLVDTMGDRVQVAYISGTDFGTQRGPMISVQTYCELFQPFHKRVNDFIHRHTTWKTFIHSCGSVYVLIPHFIDAGFDILNPVQCSAADMEPRRLKRHFGHRIVFWGGGVDTQTTMAFGTPNEVYDQVCERIGILGENGGFVFNPVHNIQAPTPTENMLAMFRAIAESADCA